MNKNKKFCKSCGTCLKRDRILNLASFIILGLFWVIVLIPRLFSKSFGFWNKIYYDNVYYSLNYLIFTLIALSGPFIFIASAKNWIRWSSLIIGSWFAMCLVFEIMNFQNPELVYNNNSEDSLYFKFLIGAMIATIFIITNTLTTWVTERAKLQE